MGPSVPSIAPVRYRGRRRVVAAILFAATLLVAACGSPAPDGDLADRVIGPVPAQTPSSPSSAPMTASTAQPVTASTAPTTRPTAQGSPTAQESPTAPAQSVPPPPADVAASAGPAPGWLGRRPLPTTPDGDVVVPQATPDELIDRRFVTVDRLPPPAGTAFESTIGPVEPDVLARSTWQEDCPVAVDGLAYVTVSFWGFDGRPHTGELIVARDAAADLVVVFERLHRERFPIEEMRVTARSELDAPPTGDGNNTTAFVCRPVTGGSSFSEHAYGLAIDVNPFLNPYRRGDLVLPELAAAHLERSARRAGMITDGDAVVDAFASIGWSWGGDWKSLKDYQHFSANGR